MKLKYPDKESRKQKALNHLETRKPVCTGCGEMDWRCFEAHHIAGQDHHDDTALICRNCHAEVTDSQKDHPVDTDGQDTQLATIGHYLFGLSDLFRLIADTLLEFEQDLLDRANGGSISRE